MAIQLGMGFDLSSPQYLDSRQSFNTLEEMYSADKNTFPEGFLTYNKEDKKYYALSRGLDDVLEWEEFSSGGGGNSGNNTAPMVTIDESTKTMFALSEHIKIPFYVVDAEGGKMTATYYINDEEKESKIVSLSERNIWDVGQLPKGTYSLRIKVTDQFGLSGMSYINISVGQLEISSSFNDPPQDYTVDMPLSILYTVDITDFTNVKAYYTIDDETQEPINITKRSNEWKIGHLDKGVHTLKIQLTKDAVYSNILEYTIAVLDSEGLYISSSFDITECTVEEKPLIHYRISTQLNETMFKTHCFINEKETVLTSYMGPNQWDVGYLEIGEYTLKMHTTTYDGSIKSNEIEFKLKVVKASEELEPSVIDSSLIYWMDARDNSNSVVETRQNLIDRSGKNVVGKLYGANFSSNGWINDELVLNGECYAEIDLAPLSSIIRNGLTLDVQYTITNVGDINGRAISCEDSENPHNGIYIDSQDCSISGDGSRLYLPSIENEVVRTTFVIDRKLGLVLIYTNAVACGVMKVSDLINFTTTSKLYLNARKNSNSGLMEHFGNSKIRNIRLYNRTLSHEEILQNHISDMKLEQQKLMKAKNYPKSNQGLPKITIIGDLSAINSATSTSVSVYRTVILESNGNTDVMAYSEDEVRIKPQGTSSLSYPVKNFKFKFAGVDGKGVQIHKDWKKDKTYTIKADFMDSTHSNNLGCAKYISSIYKNPIMVDGQPVRSCIDGFPCLAFNKLTPESPETFIGIYNWNLDKGSTKDYGLQDKAGHLLYVGDMNDNTGEGAVGFWEWEDMELIKQSWECEHGGDIDAEDKTDHPELQRLIKWVATIAKSTLDIDDPVALAEAKARAKKQFNDEVSQYFDKDYLIDYLLSCLVLGMVDSLGKNMRLVTYDGMVWYTTFYDMDTVLGLDNSGKRTFNPDVELHEYNTSNSALWTCVMDYMYDDVRERYMQLRVDKKLFTLENILKYFNGEIIEKIGEVYYNRELFEKYLPFGEAHLEKVHGNRQAELKRWISERLIFVDSLFEVGPEYGKPITMRLQKTKEGPEYATFSLKAYSNQYVRVQYGINTPDSHLIKVNKDGFTDVTGLIKSNDLDVMISSAGQIMAVNGLNTLSMSHFKIDQAARIVEIDVSNNKRLEQLALDLSQDIEIQRYLQILKCRNCTGFSSTSKLDLTQCYNLKEVDASNSSIPSVTFSVGGSLKSVNLSNTNIVNFNIQKHEYLQTINVSNCNRLNQYNLEGCNNIREISLTNLPLTSVSIVNCENVEKIDLSGCFKLSTLNLSYLPKLKEINISNCSINITQLDLTNSPNIETIIARNASGLTTIKLNKQCKSLKYLDLSQTTIRDILIGNESIGRGVNLTPFKLQYAKFENCQSLVQIRGINLVPESNSSSIFYNCKKLTSITGTITLVGSCSQTFDGCAELQMLPEIIVDNSVSYLYRTFSGCNSITIEHVKTIFEQATNVISANETFMNCNGITGQIPENLLDNCTKLVNLNYTFSNCKLTGNIPSGLFKNNTKLQTLNNTFELNNGLNGVISEGLFNSCTELQSLDSTFNGCKLSGQLPANLFANNENITNLNKTFINNNLSGEIPGTLFNGLVKLQTLEKTFAYNKQLSGNIPENLFNGLVKLESVSNMFEGCTQIGLNKQIPENLFNGCIALKYVDGFFSGKLFTGSIPENLFSTNTELVSTISLFDNCTELTGTISNKLFSNCKKISIITSIFSNCSKITSIEEGLFTPFKSKLQYCQSAFSGCNGLVGNIPNDLISNSPELVDASRMFANCYDIISTIPEDLFTGCTSLRLASNFFANCKKLKGLIPAKLFADCVDLENISGMFDSCKEINKGSVLPTGLFENNRNLQYIDSLFSNCSDLGTSGLDKLNDIPSNIFENCKRIRSASGLFNGCNSLSGEIPYNMFNGCDLLTNISSMFSNCVRLTGDIPAELFKGCTSIYIMDSTFNNCYGLELLPINLFEDCKPTINKVVSSLFKGCSKLSGYPIQFWNGYNVTSSLGCYVGCTNLNGQETIPSTYL